MISLIQRKLNSIRTVNNRQGVRAAPTSTSAAQEPEYREKRQAENGRSNHRRKP